MIRRVVGGDTHGEGSREYWVCGAYQCTHETRAEARDCLRLQKEDDREGLPTGTSQRVLWARADLERWLAGPRTDGRYLDLLRACERAESGGAS